jgi:hypothetical protein
MTTGGPTRRDDAIADDQELERKFAAMLSCLDERQRRPLAAEARPLVIACRATSAC